MKPKGGKASQLTIKERVVNCSALVRYSGIIKKLGLCPYRDCWLKMENFTLHRDATTLDEIWLVEHERVFTQGMAGKAEHVLDAGDIPVIQTDRGGQITYHGPGQLVCYVLFDLRRLKIGVKKFVNLLEQCVIDTLFDYGIHAATIDKAPGVYVSGKKICSIGLRIRRGCSYHGVALNVNNDLEPFTRINPCGFRGLEVTRVSNFVNVTLDEVGQNFCKKLIGTVDFL